MAGLVALVIAFAWPQTYESVTILQAEPATASLIGTAAVLDPAVTALGLGQGQSIESARDALRGRIKTSSGRTDKLLTITVSGARPTQAQAAAKAVLAAAYAQSQPIGVLKVRLDTQLVNARARLENARVAGSKVFAAFDRVYKLDSPLKSGVGELARNYAELQNVISAAQALVLQIEGQLDGLTDSQLVQTPSLPVKAASPKKGMVAVGATLATGFLLLLLVFIRNGLQSAEADPVSAAKLARIRRALSLRPKA